MKCQVLHTAWCYIPGKAAGEIWNWSLLGVKGLNHKSPIYVIARRSKKVVFVLSRTPPPPPPLLPHQHHYHFHSCRITPTQFSIPVLIASFSYRESWNGWESQSGVHDDRVWKWEWQQELEATGQEACCGWPLVEFNRSRLSRGQWMLSPGPTEVDRVWRRGCYGQETLGCTQRLGTRRRSSGDRRENRAVAEVGIGAI